MTMIRGMGRILSPIDKLRLVNEGYRLMSLIVMGSREPDSNRLLENIQNLDKWLFAQIRDFCPTDIDSIGRTDPRFKVVTNYPSPAYWHMMLTTYYHLSYTTTLSTEEYRVVNDKLIKHLVEECLIFLNISKQMFNWTYKEPVVKLSLFCIRN